MAKRTYENNSIRVFWDSTRCVHSGNCLRALPAVFDFDARPWVDVDGDDSDAIAAAIQRCPSGALDYERLDGGPPEPLPEVPVIIPRPNGPLFVRGRVSVQTIGGEIFDEAGRMTLCRCGASENQPFCDNSHRVIKFKDNPRIISPERQAAASPDETTGGDGGATKNVQE